VKRAKLEAGAVAGALSPAPSDSGLSKAPESDAEIRAACGGTTATSDRETRSSVKRKSMKVLQKEAIEKELNYARQIKLDRADTRRKRKLWEV
jgi:hypothetical protein